MTKLRSGEVLYRDVGYVNLPLHDFVRNPDKIDSRLSITHPINKIDAFVDCSIRVKHDSFQSTVPSNVGLVLNKKMSRTLSMAGIVDKPAKKSLISINSQYFDTTHVEGETAVTTLRRVPLSRYGSMNQSLVSVNGTEKIKRVKSEDSEEDDEEVSPSKILMMEKGNVSYFLQSTLKTAPSDNNIVILPGDLLQSISDKRQPSVQFNTTLNTTSEVDDEDDEVNGEVEVSVLSLSTMSMGLAQQDVEDGKEVVNEGEEESKSDSLDYTAAYHTTSVFDMSANVTMKPSGVKTSPPTAAAVSAVEPAVVVTALVE
eukprot:gene28778-35698_t